MGAVVSSSSSPSLVSHGEPRLGLRGEAGGEGEPEACERGEAVERDAGERLESLVVEREAGEREAGDSGDGALPKAAFLKM